MILALVVCHVFSTFTTARIFLEVASSPYEEVACAAKNQAISANLLSILFCYIHAIWKFYV